MTWFIFAGDMLVMLFMVGLIIWVFMVMSDKAIDDSANIPLQDENYGSDLQPLANPVMEPPARLVEKGGVDG